MNKKLYSVLRILMIITGGGLILYFYLTANSLGVSFTACFIMFINTLLSVLRDNKIESAGGSDLDNKKRKALSKKEKVFEIVTTVFIIIFISLFLLSKRLPVNTHLVFIIGFPILVILCIAGEIMGYKK